MNTYTFPLFSTQSLNDVLPAFDRILKDIDANTMIYFKVRNNNKFQVNASSATEKFTVYIDLADTEIQKWVSSIENTKIDGITKSSVSHVADGIACVLSYNEFFSKLKSINRNRKIASLTTLKAVESTEKAAAVNALTAAEKVAVEAVNEVIETNTLKPVTNYLENSMKFEMLLPTAVTTLEANIRRGYDFNIFVTVDNSTVEFNIPRHDTNAQFALVLDKASIVSPLPKQYMLLTQADALLMLQHAYNISQRSGKIKSILQAA